MYWLQLLYQKESLSILHSGGESIQILHIWEKYQ